MNIVIYDRTPLLYENAWKTFDPTNQTLQYKKKIIINNTTQLQ